MGTGMSDYVPQGSKILRRASVALALWLGGAVAHAAYVNSYYRKPAMDDLLELEIRRNDPARGASGPSQISGC